MLSSDGDGFAGVAVCAFEVSCHLANVGTDGAGEHELAAVQVHWELEPFER